MLFRNISTAPTTKNIIYYFETNHNAHGRGKCSRMSLPQPQSLATLFQMLVWIKYYIANRVKRAEKWYGNGEPWKLQRRLCQIVTALSSLFSQTKIINKLLSVGRKMSSLIHVHVWVLDAEYIWQLYCINDKFNYEITVWEMIVSLYCSVSMERKRITVISNWIWKLHREKLHLAGFIIYTHATINGPTWVLFGCDYHLIGGYSIQLIITLFKIKP